MTRLFTVLLFIVAMPFFACSQSNNEKSIRKMLAAQVVEWNKANMEGFMKGYWESDSLLFIGSKGPTYGFGPTLARYKKSYPDTDHSGTLTSTILSIKKLSRRYYFVVGKWALARKAGDVGGSYTLLLHKVKGEWVIVADHSS
jgi:hypothetical protein